MTQRCGSPGYMAPEVVRGAYTELCDLWSLGVVFYQMATGKRLWPLTPTHEQHYDQVLAETPLTLKSNAYWNRLGPGALEMAQDLLSLECRPHVPSRTTGCESTCLVAMTGAAPSADAEFSMLGCAGPA